ncbi:substrate-binding domain-containing protein [Haloarchaeobius sp. TZWWS8]|uniref:substrate-binding domain-containing protein n=1 Tax=Haloarchaeobius sp. TZWWS8 TaxID=3446121 RepID=UPI003EBBB9AD
MARDTNNRIVGAESHRSTGGSRRTFLKAAAGTSTVALAGCLGNIGGAGGSTDSLTYGVVSPVTGAYKGLGPNQRKGAKLAIEQLQNDDSFEFEVDAVYKDTGTDSTQGTKEAKAAVEKDGANFLMGAISSSVAIAMNKLAKDQQVIYNPGGAAVPVTGSECNEYVFRAETNTAQVAEAVSDYTVNNLGTKVWFHIADYAYGTSVQNRVQKRMEKSSADVEIVGTSKSELGARNFDTYISDIKNSDAEVVVIGMTGGDLITFVQQANDKGLKEQVNLMAPTMTFQVVRGALGSAAYGTYGGVRYVADLDVGTNKSFVDAYMNKHDSPPDNFARVGYQSIMMTAEGVKKAGSTNSDDVIDALAGLEMDTILGTNQFRECDHQALNPTWMAELVEPSSGEMADVKVLKKVEGKDAMIPCSETGCSL